MLGAVSGPAWVDFPGLVILFLDWPGLVIFGPAIFVGLARPGLAQYILDTKGS